MRNIIFRTLVFAVLLFAACLNVQAQIVIDETNFPDAIFRSYISAQFDKDEDSALSDTELFSVKKIDCSYKNISSLEGIQHFVLLMELNCEKNNLDSLDVSKNTLLSMLNCEWNNLTSLDVSMHTAMLSLSCGYNKLASLDVSNNTALNKLYCQNNNLDSLDVSKNTALTVLSCGYNNLTSLDVSNNTALTDLSCVENDLDSLDVSIHTALKELQCAKNNLTSLDVTNNTALTRLWCDVNNLTSLDLSKNTKLKDLQCGCNNLASLDLSKNTKLTELYCDENSLTSLDLSNNTALEWLYCGFNNITSLDLSKNTALEWLHCGGNCLTDLDLTKNSSLFSVVLTGQHPIVEVAVGGSARNKLAVPFPEIESSRLISMKNQNQTVSSPEYVTIGGENNLVIATANNADIHFTNPDNSKVYYVVKPKYASSVSNSVKTNNMTVYMHYLPFHALYLNPMSVNNNRDGVYTGTLYLDVPTVIPTDCDLKVYSAANITEASEEEGRLVLQEQSGILPTGSGVVVTATESGCHLFAGDAEIGILKQNQMAIESITYNITPTPYATNILAGTYESEGLAVNRGEVLTLGPRRDDGSGTVGFWNYAGTKINPFRCYIPKDQIPSAMLTPKFQGFSFLYGDEDDTVTAIETASTGYAAPAISVYYDLQGRRVSNPRPGSIYIVNGRKVVVPKR